ncbi:MAG TPA: ATP-binding protein [Daejeonella sp.]|nr:ATP-binding protein [Daejeonella sp.]
MKVKLKLQLGLGLLFTLILIVGILGTYYLLRLSEESSAVLQNNYKSLQYMQRLSVLVNVDVTGSLNDGQSRMFEQNLKAQERNITETGEGELTHIIRQQFNILKQPKLSSERYSRARETIENAIRSVDAVNLQAIYKKNDVVMHTIRIASIYLGGIFIVCLIIGFSFILNFPGYIADPIKELTEGIKAIANKNYKQRLDFYSNDEYAELATAFNSMAKKLAEYESSNLAKILFEKSRIEALIDNMSDAIIGLDEKQYILFVNSLASMLIGLNADELIGRYAPDVALFNDLIRTLLTVRKKELKIYSEGKENYFTTHFIEVKNEGRTIGQLIVLQDTTSFHELDAAKTNFIATISHELKTPIASIITNVNALGEEEQTGAINAKQEQLIKHIGENASRLFKITGELMDLAQVETGNIQLKTMPVAPHELINYAVNATRFQAAQKSINVVISLEPDLPQLQIDMDKTAWVLLNFLSNALRYSPQNSEVIIKAYKKERFIEFSVQDFGSGIEEKYQKRLFDRYFQVPTPDKIRSGIGLGLTISKDFIEAQHGEIFMESQVGQGSTFGFRLPFAP